MNKFREFENLGARVERIKENAQYVVRGRWRKSSCYLAAAPANQHAYIWTLNPGDAYIFPSEKVAALTLAVMERKDKTTWRVKERRAANALGLEVFDNNGPCYWRKPAAWWYVANRMKCEQSGAERRNKARARKAACNQFMNEERESKG